MKKSIDYPYPLNIRISEEHDQLIKDHMRDCGINKTDAVRYLLDFYLYYNNTTKEKDQ